MSSERSKSDRQKALLRRDRARALARSQQRFKIGIYQASLFTAAAVALAMLLQLFVLPAPATPPTGPLNQPLLRHYALILALIPTGFLGAASAFRFMAPSRVPATRHLLLLGAVFAMLSYLSFMLAVDFAGVVGGLLWLFALAVGCARAAQLLPAVGVRPRRHKRRGRLFRRRSAKPVA